MNKLEQNITNSFKLAKSDILKTQRNVIALTKRQEKIIETLHALKVYQKKLLKRLSKKSAKKNK